MSPCLEFYGCGHHNDRITVVLEPASGIENDSTKERIAQQGDYYLEWVQNPEAAFAEFMGLAKTTLANLMIVEPCVVVSDIVNDPAVGIIDFMDYMRGCLCPDEWTQLSSRIEHTLWHDWEMPYVD